MSLIEGFNNPHPFEKLEQEMRDMMAEQPGTSSVLKLPRLIDQEPVKTPSYIEQKEGVPRVGELSAAAVATDYEAAAKHIEEMGKELLKMAAKCEAMAKDALDAVEYINKTPSTIATRPKKHTSRSNKQQ
jgi:hypothetical protein